MTPRLIHFSERTGRPVDKAPVHRPVANKPLHTPEIEGYLKAHADEWLTRNPVAIAVGISYCQCSTLLALLADKGVIESRLSEVDGRKSHRRAREFKWRAE